MGKLPLEEIEEIYDMVSLLKGHAAELAARNIDNSELTELKKLQKRLVLFASRNKYQDYIKENTEFHHLITSLSGNNNLVKINPELRARIYRYRLIGVTIPGYLENTSLTMKKLLMQSVKKIQPVPENI